MNTFQTYIRMNGREIVNGQRILIIAYQSFDWKVTEDARMYKEKKKVLKLAPLCDMKKTDFTSSPYHDSRG